MATIVTRAGKASPLTNQELDSNFNNLNTDKAELSGAVFTGDVASTGFSGDITGAVLFQAKAGEGLTKGDPVYISGISGNQTVVSKADANDANKMPCFGIVDATVSINANCSIVTFGTLADLNTSAFSEGDELYISDTGTLSATAPTGEASQLQKIAKVTRSHASAGSIKVMGAGRTNATPNLDDGKFFLGNSSNQSASATFSTSVTGIALPLSGGVMSGAITTNSTFDGRDVATDGTKLDGIEASATADQTGAQIKTAYEAETNAFTDAQFTKLGGIEASADVTANAGALMDSELTSIASVKALNQGVATGDSPTFAGLVATTADINGGTIDGTVIGGATPVAATVTTFTSTGIDDNATSTAITIDASENVGIGCTPSPWFGSKALEFGFYGSISADSVGSKFGTNIAQNAYASSEGAEPSPWKYITSNTNARPSLYQQYDGGHYFSTAATGTAGNAITWSKSMTLANNGDISFYDDSGNAKLFWDSSAESLGIGTSSPSMELDVRNDGASGVAEIGVRGGTNGAGVVQISGHGTTYGSTSFDLIQNSGAAYVLQRANLPLIFGTNGTNRMTIDSSGQVRLGNSTPTWDTTFSSLVTKGGFLGSQSASYLYSGQNGYYNGGWKYSSTAPATLTEQAAGTHIFYNAASGSAGATISWAERMRIDSSGNVLVGKSDASDTVAGGKIASDGRMVQGLDGTGAADFHDFYRGTAGSLARVGNIRSSGTTVAYNTSSDYRLKEDDVPMTGATERVKALRPINFAWKLDGSRVDGFLAHEAQEVVPECATGTKDAMRDEEYEVTAAIEEVRDADDNVTTEAVEAVMGSRSVPDYQGIDQAKLVPLLVAALQEAIARIEILESGV